MNGSTTRREFMGMGLALAGTALAGCAGQQYSGDGWQRIVDGRSVPGGWTKVGMDGWSVVDGTLQGAGTTPAAAAYLVSPQNYTDFELRAEFWASHDCNSGIFIRCQDRGKVGADNAYEVNIFDQRPEPKYGTGAIVNIATVDPMPKAGNRWNIFDVTARGDHLVVFLNDQPPKSERGGPVHHLGIETDDLDALVAKMQADGFQFRKPVRVEPKFKYVMVAGPDSLLIELFQSLEPERWKIGI